MQLQQFLKILKISGPSFYLVFLSLFGFAWFCWCLFKEYLYANAVNAVLRLILSSYPAVGSFRDYGLEMQLTACPPLRRCSWETVWSKVYFLRCAFAFIFFIIDSLIRIPSKLVDSTVSTVADDVLWAPQWLFWFFPIPARLIYKTAVLKLPSLRL